MTKVMTPGSASARAIPVPSWTFPDQPAGSAPAPSGGPAAVSGPANKSMADERPWSSSAFWILQLVVLAVYLIRLASLVEFHLDVTSLAVECSTFALFIVPVVYAALNFGFRGAVFTSGWVTLLALPRIFSSLDAHQYDATWFELTQLALLGGLAGLVGQRVSAERRARQRAEEAS